MSSPINVKKTRADLCRHIGDISQVSGAKEYQFTSGRAIGTRAIDVNNGAGLNFTILPGRGMDIAYAFFKGDSLTYISQTGVVSSNFYEKDGLCWRRSFFGGLLTTCGLTQVGFPCVDDGEEFGLHGRISNIEAEDVGIDQKWVGDDYIIQVKGVVRQASFNGEYLKLERIISVKMAENKITLSDSVENCGFSDQPFMILYHFNFGYPLVSATSKLMASRSCVQPFDDLSAKHIDEHRNFCEPFSTPQHAFRHKFSPDKDGYIYAGIVNEESKRGCYLKLIDDQFSEVNQWKMMNEGEYVVGIEPTFGTLNGRAEARKSSSLYFLKPGEIKHFNIEVCVLDSKDEIEQYKEMIQ